VPIATAGRVDHGKAILVKALGGFDCALLVVADDDDPVPETREYLAILDPLGVAESAVAITKVDRTSRDRVAGRGGRETA